MGDKKRKALRFPPCPPHDVEALESWLEDMARQGLFLAKDGITLGIFTFERRDPADTRYRLEAAQHHIGTWADAGSDPEPEAVEMSRDAGWEYLCSYGQFFIYRAMSEDAPELNTDPAVQSLAVKKVRRREMGSLFYTLVMVAITVYMTLRGGVVLLALDMGVIRFLLVAAILLWAIITGVEQTSRMHKLYKQLKNGCALEHKKDWRRKALAHRLSALALAAVLLLWVGLSISRCTGELSREMWTPYEEFEGTLPFARMEELIKDGEFEPGSIVDSEVICTGDLFAPTLIELRQSGRAEGSEDVLEGGITVNYFEMENEFLAKLLYGDILKNAKTAKRFEIMDGPEIHADGYVYYHDYFPTLLLRKGNVVVTVKHYSFDESTVTPEQWLPVFAESVK